MAEKKIDINALGQAIDTTFGRSSTPQTASYSVKISLQGGDRLLAIYKAIVNFGTEREMVMMKRLYVDESKQAIDAAMKHVKQVYKDLSGKSLSTKESSSDDSLEIIQFNVHNPKRTAYFCRKTILEVG